MSKIRNIKEAWSNHPDHYILHNNKCKNRLLVFAMTFLQCAASLVTGNQEILFCVSILWTEKHLSDLCELSFKFTDLSSGAVESGSRGMTTTNKGNKALKVFSDDISRKKKPVSAVSYKKIIDNCFFFNTQF